MVNHVFGCMREDIVLRRCRLYQKYMLVVDMSYENRDLGA